jgi:hypothetical protein
MVSTFQLTRTARLTGAPESTEKREESQEKKVDEGRRSRGETGG